MTLSDADVMQLADKSCAGWMPRPKVASAKGNIGAAPARLVKGMPKEVEGVTLNYKVYETRGNQRLGHEQRLRARLFRPDGR